MEIDMKMITFFFDTFYSYFLLTKEESSPKKGNKSKYDVIKEKGIVEI